MKLETIVAIELTTRCNLACGYCVNPLMEHSDMSDSVFNATLCLIDMLMVMGTQGVVSLSDTGESLLVKDFFEKAEKVRDIVGLENTMLYSNGILIDEETASKLYGVIGGVVISVHGFEHSAAKNLFKSGVPFRIRDYPKDRPHNWGGSYKVSDKAMKCFESCRENTGYVKVDGSVTSCCFDYTAENPIGHVYDSDILNKNFNERMYCDGRY